ncbi:MAG: hypothetical protein K0R58_757 [Ramlibacter sp.]|jgi:hypothetical protein|nr:hypothetical protein [Ramlibacter sp.]
MFSWLKRLLAPAKPPSAARRAAPDRKAAPAGSRGSTSRTASPPGFLPSAPAALPEVLGEGNTQADWSVWEDSMTALDSQMQEDIMPSARVYVRDTRPSPMDEPDAFSSVRRKRDV